MSTSTIIDRISSLLETTAPFEHLPPIEHAAILRDISIEYFEAGEVILEQGVTMHPGLYLVESGLVRLMDVTQQRLMNKVGAGEHFGSFGLIKGGATIYEAKAVEPTVCALLKGERFQKLYNTYEDFASYFESDLRMYVRRMGTTMDITGGHILFSRSLSQFVHRRLVAVDSETPLRDAAQLMQRQQVDSLLVLNGQTPAGIITDADFRNRVVGKGLYADAPVKNAMSTPIVTVPVEDSLYDAMMIMLAKNVQRLVLVEGPGRARRPVSIITNRDISHLRGQDPVSTTNRIRDASSIEELASIRNITNEELLNLYRQGAQPEMLNRIMMVFYDRLAIRVLELVEAGIRRRAEDGPLELPWTWMRLGSGGRQEMALNSEQHNALVYADPEPEMAERAESWFNAIAERVNWALETCGFRPSQFVASDSRWRKPIREWKREYREWILQANEESLAPTPIFFDMRPIYGDAELADELRLDIYDALNVQAMDEDRKFLRLMSMNAMEHRPPTGLLRKVLDTVGDQRRTMDLREGGVQPIVDAARVLALEVRYMESSNTFDRLRRAAEDIPDLARVIDDALEAYQYLVDFRLESQLRAVESGDAPSNHIDISSLNRMQQRLLRNAFSHAAALQDALAKRHGLSRKWLGRD